MVPMQQGTTRPPVTWPRCREIVRWPPQSRLHGSAAPRSPATVEKRANIGVSLPNLREDLRPGVTRYIVRHGEGSEGARALGVHAPLGNNLAIEMGELLDHPDILRECGTTPSGCQSVQMSLTGAPVACVRYGGLSVMVSFPNKAWRCGRVSEREAAAHACQGELRMTLQKLPRWKCRSLSAITSALTLPKVVSGLCLMPS